ncbi:hypothetical protein D3C72_1189560 [compost metagenome]
MRRVLGHVGGGTAVLAAERQALQHAQRDQDHRRRDADGRVAGQEADDERRQAHDQDGHQEGVLATDHVAQAAEHDGAERTHQEAGGERQQREDEGRARIQAAEELLRDDRGERTVQIEVVPLEHGAERGGEDDLLLLRGHGPGGRMRHSP